MGKFVQRRLMKLFFSRVHAEIPVILENSPRSKHTWQSALGTSLGYAGNVGQSHSPSGVAMWVQCTSVWVGPEFLRFDPFLFALLCLDTIIDFFTRTLWYVSDGYGLALRSGGLLPLNLSIWLQSAKYLSLSKLCTKNRKKKKKQKIRILVLFLF